MSQCEKNLDAVFVLSSKSWITHCIHSSRNQYKVKLATLLLQRLVKKLLLEASDLQIGSNVIAFDKNKQRKVFSENYTIWARDALNISDGK